MVLPLPPASPVPGGLSAWMPVPAEVPKPVADLDRPVSSPGAPKRLSASPVPGGSSAWMPRPAEVPKPVADLDRPSPGAPSRLSASPVPVARRRGCPCRQKCPSRSLTWTGRCPRLTHRRGCRPRPWPVPDGSSAWMPGPEEVPKPVADLDRQVPLPGAPKRLSASPVPGGSSACRQRRRCPGRLRCSPSSPATYELVAESQRHSDGSFRLNAGYN